jgi:UDP-N-acetylmuramoyl-tripeptide--D-alanyl-D-alanine ligase
MTPRSINTIGGIVKDVNDDLPPQTQIYIAEAGARQTGDIEEIALFLEPQYAIIGSVGEQHIEYFKTLDNIIYTKMELLKSPRLKHGFVHNSIPIKDYDTITKFPNDLKIISNDLNGICFEISINNQIEQFKAPILGQFNAINLSAVILAAYKFGIKLEDIKMTLLNIKPVEHRLCLNKIGGKTILDDSFNGNLEGMLEAINIAKTFDGKKIIITPGIVESTKEANITLAKAIDKVFDFVIITSCLNKDILKENIIKTKTLVLSNKKDLERALIEHSKSGDLILFANDAPNFI